MVDSLLWLSPCTLDPGNAPRVHSLYIQQNATLVQLVFHCFRTGLQHQTETVVMGNPTFCLAGLFITWYEVLYRTAHLLCQVGLPCHELSEHFWSGRNPLVAVGQGNCSNASQHLWRSRSWPRPLLLLLRPHHPRRQDGQLHHGIPRLKHSHHLPLHSPRGH